MEFRLTDRVFIKESEEEGVVIGRASYVNSDNQYLVRYKAADGRCVENWWYEDALSLQFKNEIKN